MSFQNDAIKEEFVKNGFKNIEVVDEHKLNIFKNEECLFSEKYSNGTCESGYTVKNPLPSQGNQSQVFHASCGDNDKYVAKMVRFKDNNEKHSFFNEVLKQIKILQLDHELAPKVHEIWICDDKAVVVMDLLEGDTLENHLKMLKENLEEDDIETVLKKVNEHISILHGNGWIHGDLHSRNIIVLKNGEIYFVDFQDSSHRPNFFEQILKLDLETLKKDLIGDVLGESYAELVEESFSQKKVRETNLSEYIKRVDVESSRSRIPESSVGQQHQNNDGKHSIKVSNVPTYRPFNPSKVRRMFPNRNKNKYEEDSENSEEEDY